MSTPSGLPSFSAVCPAINGQLRDIAINSPEQVRSMTGTLLALTSPENRQGIKMDIPAPQDGKLRPVQIMYGQRGLASDVNDTETPCVDWSGAVEPNNLAETIAPTDFLYVEDKLLFNVDDMRELCESPNSFMANQINNTLDALAQAINAQCIASMAGAFGTYTNGNNSGSSPASLALLGTIATNVEAPQLVKWARSFRAEVTRLRYSGTPITIGMGEFYAFIESTTGGGINMGGINVSNVGVKYFADNAVETGLANANYFISMQAGAMQLVTQNRFVGDFIKTAGDYFSYGTIKDPITNLTYDIYIKFDPDCQQYKVQLSLHYLPYALFNASQWKVGDPLYGNTFIHQWNAA